MRNTLWSIHVHVLKFRDRHVYEELRRFSVFPTQFKSNHFYLLRTNIHGTDSLFCNFFLYNCTFMNFRSILASAYFLSILLTICSLPLDLSSLIKVTWTSPESSLNSKHIAFNFHVSTYKL